MSAFAGRPRGPVERRGFPVAWVVHGIVLLIVAWVFLPRYAPSVVAMAPGREICAMADTCRVAPQRDCVEVIAQNVSLMHYGYGTLGECASCLEVTHCAAWHTQECRLNSPHCLDGKRRVLEDCHRVCEPILPVTAFAID
jgi:hypothetical protein